MKRLKLLLILASMPSEAYGWLLLAIAQKTWPDGTGGFSPASREAIEGARTEAQAQMLASEDV